MVNVGINIPYIGSYKLRLWVFTSFSVDLICIATFFYTSTGGARWEYHSAAWLNHESNHLFSGHDPIRSRDLCFYSEYMIPWIFTSCCQSCPKKKNAKETPAICQSWNDPKWMGPPTWCRRKILELLRCLNLDPGGIFFSMRLPETYTSKLTIYKHPTPLKMKHLCRVIWTTNQQVSTVPI